MTDSLGIWLVRSQALPLGNLLKSKLGGEIICGWQDIVPSTLSAKQECLMGSKITQTFDVVEDIVLTTTAINTKIEYEQKQKEKFARLFSSYSNWILVMASGIAMRFLNKLIVDKHIDPAVVVLDEGGHHAISLLSGHEGGANVLAYKVANAVGANPIITTATESLKPLIIGIGCRKQVSVKQIETLVLKVLDKRSINEVRLVATIDLKEDEPGLQEFCAKHNLPLRVFSRTDVMARPWVTNASKWVQESIGLDGVCEPCALMASPRGHLLVPKTNDNGVAVAVVEDELRFSE